ncbi:hypothetical protein [Celeribacter halophilus]|uniref:hypothetical protein n=1 Tax=Celeribacter halophilus TaxID=576117 RepID=UPI003A92D4EA
MKRLNLRIAHKRIAEKKARQNAAKLQNQKSLTARFFKLSRSIYFVIGFALGLMADALSIPKAIVDFEHYLGGAKDYAYRLAYRPANWSGVFDAFPEGITDINDLGILVPAEVTLKIESHNGNGIDGRVWWNKSCDFGVPHKGLLLQGRINIGGSTADVQVFDFFNGKRLDLFEGQLINDGIMIEFKNFPNFAGLNGNRISKNPAIPSLESENDLFCNWFLDTLNQSFNTKDDRLE